MRLTPSLLPCAAIILSMLALAVYPPGAAAQSPRSEQIFIQRMASRVDSMQFQIRRLQKELDGGADVEGRPRSGDTGSVSGLRRQLDAMDEQCRQLERRLRGMGISSSGSPHEVYEQQRQIEYNVYTLERQLVDIRRWIKPPEEEEKPVETEAEPDEPEDGMTDEEWAEQWATGGQ